MDMMCISWVAGKIILTFERTWREYFPVISWNRLQCELLLEWVNLASSVLFHSSMFSPRFLWSQQYCPAILWRYGNSDQLRDLAENQSSRKKLIQLLTCLHMLCADARGAGTGCRVRSSKRIGLSSVALDSETAP